jgi:hypothetical protein
LFVLKPKITADLRRASRHDVECLHDFPTFIRSSKSYKKTDSAKNESSPRSSRSTKSPKPTLFETLLDPLLTSIVIRPKDLRLRNQPCLPHGLGSVSKPLLWGGREEVPRVLTGPQKSGHECVQGVYGAVGRTRSFHHKQVGELDSNSGLQKGRRQWVLVRQIKRSHVSTRTAAQTRRGLCGENYSEGAACSPELQLRSEASFSAVRRGASQTGTPCLSEQSALKSPLMKRPGERVAVGQLQAQAFN